MKNKTKIIIGIIILIVLLAIFGKQLGLFTIFEEKDVGKYTIEEQKKCFGGISGGLSNIFILTEDSNLLAIGVEKPDQELVQNMQFSLDGVILACSSQYLSNELGGGLFGCKFENKLLNIGTHAILYNLPGSPTNNIPFTGICSTEASQRKLAFKVLLQKLPYYILQNNQCNLVYGKQLVTTYNTLVGCQNNIIIPPVIEPPITPPITPPKDSSLIYYILGGLAIFGIGIYLFKKK